MRFPMSQTVLRFVGGHESSLEMARGRLVFLSGILVVCFIVVLAKSIDLAVIQGGGYEERASYLSKSDGDEITLRADIVDRHGVLLARSLSFSSLYADPELVRDPDALVASLMNIFPDIDRGDTLEKLKSDKRFVWIKRNITPAEQEQILYLGNPALNFKNEMQRMYPHENLLSHVLGASGIDGQGLSGLERSFESFLQEKDNLELTIDVRIQHALKREVAKAMKKYKAVGGGGIVMDVTNGEVLAMTSLPDYDPHLYGEAKPDQIFNKMTLGVYELGSIFKIFTTAKYLEENKRGLSDRFDVRDPIKVGRFKIRDYHPEDRVLSVPEVFIHSSNIGSALMAEKIGDEKFKDFLGDLGLLERNGFDVSEVGTPIVPSPWRPVNTLTASYGHGVAVSPLQLVRAVSAMVNGGVMVSPTLVRQAVSSQPENVRVISEKTSHYIRQMMRLGVVEGTGTKADVKGYLVGGKTGTADKPGKGGYQDKKRISSFLGAFPMDKPEYIVFVMLDEPEGIKESYGYATGGWVAAPAVSKVIASMVSVLNFTPPSKPDLFDVEVKSMLPAEIREKQQIAQGRL